HLIAWISVVDTVISVFLITEFFLRLSLSEDKGWYFRRYWIDLLASIPFHQVLSFGPLVPTARLARLLRLLRLGRAMRVLRFAFRGLDKLFQTLQLNLLKRSLVIALALLFFGALSINAVEQGQAVAGVGESMWWSFATVVTGGFADLYNPSTLPGRAVTVGLVLLGLTVTGIFTASLTSVLVEDESSRIEQNQHNLETHLGVINQKLDLLSSTTNEGLIALETASQALSNQRSRTAVAQVLAETMMRDFECIQASVHLLQRIENDRHELLRVYDTGMVEATPPERVQPGAGFTGRVVAELLQHNPIADIDLEPETEPRLAIKGLAMICPLVAGRRLIGLLHVVLPEDLGRYYLYNRVPMTLAHQAAMAFHAADLIEQVKAVNPL
ncbi:MAG TPA: ion transporter, partial [Anaerolineae bacterium]